MQSTHARCLCTTDVNQTAMHKGLFTTLSSRNSCRVKASNRILFAPNIIQKAGEQPNAQETKRHRETHGPPEHADEREVAHSDSDRAPLSRSDADDPQDEPEGTAIAVDNHIKRVELDTVTSSASPRDPYCLAPGNLIDHDLQRNDSELMASTRQSPGRPTTYLKAEEEQNPRLEKLTTSARHLQRHVPGDINDKTQHQLNDQPISALAPASNTRTSEELQHQARPACGAPIKRPVTALHF